MLFAKNKTSVKVPFEGGFVELQFLSKGVKDEIKSRLAALNKGVDPKIILKLQNLKKNETPEQLPDAVFDMVNKVNAIEYYKLTHAIKSWSESAEINEENVKQLDETIFDEILKKVNEMNELTAIERKN